MVVVGGGITGAGVALDAASRGYSVALVEKTDFAAGTSSRSSKLIHGGLRYLQNFDLGLVREALLERSLLVKLAPHLVKPLPLIVPTFEGKRPDRVLGVGLNMYDVMSWRRGRDEAEEWSPARHRSIGGEEVLELIPALAGREPTAGYLFYDCQTDDVRLVLTVLGEAERFGAVIANRCEVTGLVERAGRAAGVLVRDELARRRVRARRGQRRERDRRVGRPPAPAGALRRGGGAGHPPEPRHARDAAARAARRARRGDRARRRRAHDLRAAVARPHARRHDRQRLRGLGRPRAARRGGRGLPARGRERVLRDRAGHGRPERRLRGRPAADLDRRPQEVGRHLAQGGAVRDQLGPRDDHRREAHHLEADGEARGGQDRGARGPRGALPDARDPARDAGGPGLAPGGGGRGPGEPGAPGGPLRARREPRDEDGAGGARPRGEAEPGPARHRGRGRLRRGPRAGAQRRGRAAAEDAARPAGRAPAVRPRRRGPAPGRPGDGGAARLGRRARRARAGRLVRGRGRRGPAPGGAGGGCRPRPRRSRRRQRPARHPRRPRDATPARRRARPLRSGADGHRERDARLVLRPSGAEGPRRPRRSSASG